MGSLWNRSTGTVPNLQVSCSRPIDNPHACFRRRPPNSSATAKTLKTNTSTDTFVNLRLRRLPIFLSCSHSALQRCNSNASTIPVSSNGRWLRSRHQIAQLVPSLDPHILASRDRNSSTCSRVHLQNTSHSNWASHRTRSCRCSCILYFGLSILCSYSRVLVDNLLGLYDRRTRHTALWIGLSQRLLLAIECEQSSRGKLPSWFCHRLRHYPCIRPVRLWPPTFVSYRNRNCFVRRTHNVHHRSIPLPRSSPDPNPICRGRTDDIRSTASRNKT